MPAEPRPAAQAQPAWPADLALKEASGSGPARHLGWHPEWPEAPGSSARVGAFMSTRQGGMSLGPYAGLNLGDHVGDDPSAVQANRALLSKQLQGARPAWLRQVHGSTVVDAAAALAQGLTPEADGSWTSKPGVACVVLVADCLPVLFAAPQGVAVGAAHAGWRGLAAGVVEQTALAVARAAGCAPQELSCWLGPCIGPRQFEVGADVRQAFGGGARFVSRPRLDGQARWLADLVGLTRDRLTALGLSDVTGGAWCTVEDASSFFSFRRDGVTGRMAAAVWLRP